MGVCSDLCDLFCKSTCVLYYTKKPHLADLHFVLEHSVPPEVLRRLTYLQSADQSRTWLFSIFGSRVCIHTLSTRWIWSQWSVAKIFHGNKWKPTGFTTSSERENSVSVLLSGLRSSHVDAQTKSIHVGSVPVLQGVLECLLYLTTCFVVQHSNYHTVIPSLFYPVCLA